MTTQYLKFYILIFSCSLFASGCFLFRKQAAPLPFETVTIPAGVFMVGDVFAEEDPDALPVHKAIIAPFALSKYEITYEAYDLFASATGRSLPEDDGHGRGSRAVANVTWADAVAFCAYYDFRLPSEVEWEYAARSAGKAQRLAGTDSLALIDEYVRHDKNSVMHSFQGGTKMPNELGLYDMGGNVYEWIGDYYEFYPKEGNKPIYKNLENSSMRIIRGGSFKHNRMFAQTFKRAGTLADIPSNAIGFRCAKSLLK